MWSPSLKDGRVTLVVEDAGNGIPEVVCIETSTSFGASPSGGQAGRSGGLRRMVQESQILLDMTMFKVYN